MSSVDGTEAAGAVTDGEGAGEPEVDGAGVEGTAASAPFPLSDPAEEEEDDWPSDGETDEGAEDDETSFEGTASSSACATGTNMPPTNTHDNNNAHRPRKRKRIPASTPPPREMGQGTPPQWHDGSQHPTTTPHHNAITQGTTPDRASKPQTHKRRTRNKQYVQHHTVCNVYRSQRVPPGRADTFGRVRARSRHGQGKVEAE